MTPRADTPEPHVTLTLLSPPAMAALLEGDLPGASAIQSLPLPPFFLQERWLWRYRLRQIEADPTTAPWLVRAVVAQGSGVVGHAGFHGPPGEHGMVEIGYSVAPEHRRRRFGRAAARALVHEAALDPDVRTVRASISPDNAASLAIILRLRFTHVGEQWDEEDGLELIFERPVRSIQE